MAAQFQDLTTTTSTVGKSGTQTRNGFIPTAQATVSLLEGITASDKAQAVPYIEIWRVKDDGTPLHATPKGKPAAPLNLQWAAPPKFGASLGPHERFRERPPVSLQNVKVITENPRGVILYRKVELTFLVHRPDVVFDNAETGQDRWADLLIPRNTFQMRYGWSASVGVKNGIINGQGDKANGIVGKQQLKFIVYNYEFRILKDLQFEFTIHAMEDGELQLRQQQVVITPPGGGKPIPFTLDLPVDPKEPKTKQDQQAKVGTKNLENLKNAIRQQLAQQASKGLVYFSDLLNIIFAGSFEAAFTKLGYTVNLYYGAANTQAGTTSKKYGRVKMSGKALGKFQIPMKEIEKQFAVLLKVGSQITIYNMLAPFLTLFRGEGVWDTSAESKKADNQTPLQKTPQVSLKTIIDQDNKVANVYIVDLTAEVTRLIPQIDSKTGTKKLLAGSHPTRAAIKQAVVNAGVPYISYLTGNSYIEDSTATAVLDEQMKSILMRRGLQTDRVEKTNKTDVQNQQSRQVNPDQLLYSSALQLEQSQLGNFAFDTFALVWIDFGISAFDGPFYVQEKEDNISREGFMTHLKFVSAGDDPLGTQHANYLAHQSMTAPSGAGPTNPSTGS